MNRAQAILFIVFFTGLVMSVVISHVPLALFFLGLFLGTFMASVAGVVN